MTAPVTAPCPLQEDLLIHGDSVYDIIDKQDHQAIQAELMRAPAATAAPADDPRMFLCRMNVSRNARRQMRFGDQKVSLMPAAARPRPGAVRGAAGAPVKLAGQTRQLPCFEWQFNAASSLPARRKCSRRVRKHEAECVQLSRRSFQSGSQPQSGAFVWPCVCLRVSVCVCPCVWNQ